MLKIAPTAWSVFPWSQGLDEGVDLAENKRFVSFAKKFVSMLDLAIDMLGPDLEMVEGQLQQLGIRHIRYGVMPKHYPLMGKALLNTLEHLLGNKFDEKRHDSWNAIYTFMSVSMMQGAFQELVRVYEEKMNESDQQVAAVAQPSDQSGELKPRNSRTSSFPNSQPITKAATTSQEEDTSLGSSLDEINISPSGKRNEDKGKSGTNNTRRSLFSSSEFVKRFTRRSKGW